MKKLYILHKLPTPYNDDFFRALHKEEGISLQVYHLWKGSNRRPWKTELGTGYPNRYMQPKLFIDWHSLIAAWKHTDSMFMVGDWAHFPSIALLIARVIRHSPVAIWVDTPQEHLHRPFLKKILRAAFLKWLLSRVDVIFGSGKPARRALIKIGAIPENIIDLQFVVDLEKPIEKSNKQSNQDAAKQLRASVGCQSQGIIFAMIGTIDLNKKAQDLGLQAFAECVRRSSEQIGLLVAGTGPELDQLKHLAKNLNVEKRVNFLGWQEPEAMDTIYMASDVLLHPAHYDPFPLVVVEAMSWGRPVIGSVACGSVEERVIQGVNGYSFPPGNKTALIDAMMNFVNGPTSLIKAGFEARKTAESWPMNRAVSVVKDQLNRLLVN